MGILYIKYTLSIGCCASWCTTPVPLSYCSLVAFKGLKATNKQQDDGTGVLHQVAQHPIDQAYGYSLQGIHASRRPCKTWKDQVLAAEQIGSTSCSKRQLKLVGSD